MLCFPQATVISFHCAWTKSQRAFHAIPLCFGESPLEYAHGFSISSAEKKRKRNQSKRAAVSSNLTLLSSGGSVGSLGSGKGRQTATPSTPTAQEASRCPFLAKFVLSPQNVIGCNESERLYVIVIQRHSQVVCCASCWIAIKDFFTMTDCRYIWLLLPAKYP